MDCLDENVKKLKLRLDAAANGRNYTILAASKTRDAAQINRLPEFGIFDYGENRVQEWLAKKDEIDTILKYHHIGRLQKNKIKHIIGEVYLIHSVDQIELAAEISKKATELGRVISVLLQVNTAGEAQKGGASPQELPALVEGCAGLPGIRLKGLMCMAPWSDQEAPVRTAFAKARVLFEDLRRQSGEIEVLSMGMSQDAPIALMEGANLVRIGTALFGQREI
ncbi:MAG: YggS family pyridoxal phosphate-dependent enzyme [Christensenellaceae bacterium]|jgi:pyridoxal phosphate enzyme (YggS family)|nr:YggS family pyridoxal phosphate-dependent enzyme [Christensenellaceae bacterium]